MIEDEEILDNGMPNTKLGKTCDQLFFDPNSDLAGNVGLKVLGDVVSSSEEEFVSYINSQMSQEDFVQ